MVKFKNGDIFEGTFDNDRMHGFGMFVYSNEDGEPVAEGEKKRQPSF